MAHYLKALGTGDKPRSGAYAATPNRQLLEFLRGLPALQDWHPWELARLLKAWSLFGDTSPKDSELSSSAMSSSSLNQILYGPPGTGKTWQVIRTAARIISGNDLPDEDAKKHYDQLAIEGRIRLATFHQSFSYDDFMEGIRPIMKNEETAGFEIRNGVFKEIATSAFFACLERTKGTVSASQEFERRWNHLLAAIDEAGDELTITGLEQNELVISETSKGNLKALNPKSGKDLFCGKNALAKVWAARYPAPQITSMEVSSAMGGVPTTGQWLPCIISCNP